MAWLIKPMTSNNGGGQLKLWDDCVLKQFKVFVQILGDRWMDQAGTHGEGTV